MGKIIREHERKAMIMFKATLIVNFSSLVYESVFEAAIRYFASRGELI